MVNYQLFNGGLVENRFFYDAAGQLERFQMDYINSPHPVSYSETYTWKNGDVVEVAYSNPIYSIVKSYNADPALPGDPAHLQALLRFGDLRPANAHLLTGGANVDGKGILSYTFTNGRITTYTNTNDQSTQTTTLTYAN